MSHIHHLRNTDRIFFVTVNLRRRVEPFNASEDALMIDTLEDSRCWLHFLLCGYVLMLDHWHALISVKYPLTISQVIHDVKKVSARKLHGRRETAGPLWQHQLWDRFVRHAKELSERLTYMHLNPVRNGLVSKPEDWRWSSHNNFAPDRAMVRECPIQIDYVGLPEGYRG